MDHIILTQLSRPELGSLIREALETYFSDTKKKDEPPLSSPQWFNLPQLCEYLPDRPTKQTIYNKVSKNEIPYYKDSKKLRFLKSEIDAWLLNGKQYTQAEVDNHIDKLIASK